MIEYVFFNAECSEAFKLLLKERRVDYVMEKDPLGEGDIFQIEEPIEDELWDVLDDRYDELNLRDQELLEQSSEDGVSAAGIYVELSDGRKTIAKVDPAIMNKMLGVVSMDEFNAFVESIVLSVESPDDSAICKTP